MTAITISALCFVVTYVAPGVKQDLDQWPLRKRCVPERPDGQHDGTTVHHI